VSSSKKIVYPLNQKIQFTRKQQLNSSLAPLLPENPQYLTILPRSPITFISTVPVPPVRHSRISPPKNTLPVHSSHFTVHALTTSLHRPRSSSRMIIDLAQHRERSDVDPGKTTIAWNMATWARVSYLKLPALHDKGPSPLDPVAPRAWVL
jgi:hypothetical protein